MTGTDFEDQVGKAKKREAYVSYELYHLLRAAIGGGLTYHGRTPVSYESSGGAP